MTTAAIRFAERKQFAIAAINRLTYSDDTDSVTIDLIAVVRAVAGLMPIDEADASVEACADDLFGDLQDRDEPEARADEADYRYDMARDAAMMAGILS